MPGAAQRWVTTALRALKERQIAERLPSLINVEWQLREVSGRFCERPAGDAPLACWLPVKDGLTPHGLRHGHKTWMAEDGIPEILAEQRLGHQVTGMRGLYAHASQPMREKLTAALQARWEESLRRRAAIGPHSPHSPVPLLDNLLAPFRAAPAGHPRPASR